MGQQQSQSLGPMIEKLRAKPQVVDPVAACNAKRVEMGQLKNDADRKQQEVDQCYPNEVEARNIRKFENEADEFLKERQIERHKIGQEMDRNWSLMKKIKSTTDISDEYVNKLRNEQKTLEKATAELDHMERRYRRSFLDGDPQSGVPLHILGLQTSDDKIMLLFWISSLFVLSVAAYYGYQVFGLTWSQVVMLFTIPLGVAYTLIVFYG